MSIFATKTIEQIKEEQLGSGSVGLAARAGTLATDHARHRRDHRHRHLRPDRPGGGGATPARRSSSRWWWPGSSSALAALCYSEFASTVPVAGSAYTYAYATLGEFVAWIIGWDLILEYALGRRDRRGRLVGQSRDAARATSACSFPAALSAAPGTLVHVAGGDPVTAVFNLPAVADHHRWSRRCWSSACSESASVNAVIVVIKVAVVLIVIGGRRGVHRRRATGIPFIPANTGTFGEYGWSGILRGAGVIFFAYIGFDAVSTSAQEARNPQRDMPRGILGSLAICTVLYVLVSGVMVGLVPYKAMLNQPAPMVVAIERGRAARGGTRGRPRWRSCGCW